MVPLSRAGKPGSAPKRSAAFCLPALLRKKRGWRGRLELDRRVPPQERGARPQDRCGAAATERPRQSGHRLPLSLRSCFQIRSSGAGQNSGLGCPVRPIGDEHLAGEAAGQGRLAPPAGGSPAPAQARTCLGAGSVTSRRAGSAGWQLCSARLPGSQGESSRRCRVRLPCLARAAARAARASRSPALPRDPRAAPEGSCSCSKCGRTPRPVGGTRSGRGGGRRTRGRSPAATGLGSGRWLVLGRGETPCPGQPRSRDEPGAEPPLGLFTNMGFGAAALLRPLAGSPSLCRVPRGQAARRSVP